MRLLNVKTYTLSYFHDQEVPIYAILSHTWQKEEVLFQQLGPEGSSQPTNLPGWQKIIGCCRTAAEYNVEWVWIDTCCIDRSSSQELSEAIISMYTWYRQARVCLAFLNDFEHRESLGNPGFMSDLESCKWFTRGWTIQELLAPKRVDFYNRDWQKVGGRADLADAIARASGITPDDTLDPISKISIERKLSWLSTRETTRPEDMAYCMMGLCSVSMPVLYGEGKSNALRRLREAVDQTLVLNSYEQDRRTSKMQVLTPWDFYWWFGLWLYFLKFWAIGYSSYIIFRCSIFLAKEMENRFY